VIQELMLALNGVEDPGPGQFPFYKQDNLAKKAKIAEKGEAAGKHNQPAADSQAFDATEQGIVVTIKTKGQQEARRAADDMTGYEARLHAADPTHVRATMQAKATKALGDIKSELLNAKNALALQRRNVVQHSDSLRRFKERNRLEDPAITPPPGYQIAVVMLGLFLLETILNSFFLAEGTMGGAIAAYAIAAGISVVTMAASFAIGHFSFPFMRHRNIGVKAVGFLMFIALMAVVLVFCIGIAHFRTAVESGMDLREGAMAAFNVVTTKPWAFSDILSAVLVMLSFVFCVCAMIDGYKMDDPYPQYGKRSRRRDAAEQQYNRKVALWASRIEILAGNLSDELGADLSDFQMKHGAIPTVQARRRNLLDNFNIYYDHIQEIGRYLLSVYRTANLKTRTAQAPARFNSDDWSIGPVPEIGWREIVIQQNSAEFREVSDEMVSAVKTIGDARRQMLDWIELLGRSEDHVEADRKFDEVLRRVNEKDEAVRQKTGEDGVRDGASAA